MCLRKDIVRFAIRLRVRMAVEQGMVARASDFNTGKAEGGGAGSHSQFP